MAIERLQGNWENVIQMNSFSYICGYCQQATGAHLGYRCMGNGPVAVVRL
jgi:hypothetical protein